MTKIVCIHQPDFMPWLGFFLKVYRSDLFIILDHTINNIKDTSWFRRVEINFSGKKAWLSIPLNKADNGTFQKISDMQIQSSIQAEKLFEKYKKSFEQTYSKAEYYDDYKYLFFDYFNSNENYLVKRNIDFIQEVFKILDIDVKVIRSSSLSPKGSSNELLIDLLKKVEADIYVSGDGAAAYQQDYKFNNSGILVKKNSFIPQVYKQQQFEFISGLSIIDALVNIGAHGVKDLLYSYGKDLN